MMAFRKAHELRLLPEFQYKQWVRAHSLPVTCTWFQLAHDGVMCFNILLCVMWLNPFGCLVWKMSDITFDARYLVYAGNEICTVKNVTWWKIARTGSCNLGLFCLPIHLVLNIPFLNICLAQIKHWYDKNKERLDVFLCFRSWHSSKKPVNPCLLSGVGEDWYGDQDNALRYFYIGFCHLLARQLGQTT